MSELPTKADLSKLSLRAIVAYAARSARRVQPDVLLVGEECSAVVETAIQIAERFARGSSVEVEEAERAADDASKAAERIPEIPSDEDDSAYSAVYAAAYAAKAAAAAIFSMTPSISESFGDIAEAVNTMAATVAADAVVNNAEASAEASKAAAMCKVSRVTALDDPPAKFAEAENVSRALSDFRKLLTIASASFGDLGSPVDLSVNGPLGKL